MPEITLEPGSPSERIAVRMAAEPGLKLTRREVAGLLGVTPALVDQSLQAGIGLALITAFNDGDEGRCYRAGPRLANWKQTPAPAPASPKPPAVATAAPKKAVSGNHAKRPPELQLSLLQVAHGLPLPEPMTRSAKGQTKYDQHLDTLKADGDVLTGIPKSYKSAINKAVSSYLKSRPELAKKSALLVRQIDDETVGIWRLPKSHPSLAKASGRPAARAA